MAGALGKTNSKRLNTKDKTGLAIIPVDTLRPALPPPSPAGACRRCRAAGPIAASKTHVPTKLQNPHALADFLNEAEQSPVAAVGAPAPLQMVAAAALETPTVSESVGCGRGMPRARGPLVPPPRKAIIDIVKLDSLCRGGEKLPFRWVLCLLGTSGALRQPVPSGRACPVLRALAGAGGLRGTLRSSAERWPRLREGCLEGVGLFSVSGVSSLVVSNSLGVNGWIPPASPEVALPQKGFGFFSWKNNFWYFCLENNLLLQR